MKKLFVIAAPASLCVGVDTPHFGWVTDDEARKVAAADVRNLSTVAFGAPLFDVFRQDNVPTCRDGYWHLLDARIVIEGGQVVADKRSIRR